MNLVLITGTPGARLECTLHGAPHTHIHTRAHTHTSSLLGALTSQQFTQQFADSKLNPREKTMPPKDAIKRMQFPDVSKYPVVLLHSH